VNLEASFQYRPIRDQIYTIYTTFGDALETIVLRVAIDSISDTSTRFTAYDFFAKRMTINAAMIVELAENLKKNAHVELVFFQLKRIDLPDAYEDAIQATEVTKQGILRALAE
jgi:regulator of protease activity HflC (stomatin/prohibitin superfamily)